MFGVLAISGASILNTYDAEICRSEHQQDENSTFIDSGAQVELVRKGEAYLY